MTDVDITTRVEKARWTLLRYIDGETDYKTDGRAEVDNLIAAVREEEEAKREALVEAARVPHNLNLCSEPECWEYGTWSAFDGEEWYFLCERHANEKPDWWDDFEEGREWSTGYAPDERVITLVTTLRNAGASPPAHPSEVEGMEPGGGE